MTAPVSLVGIYPGNNFENLLTIGAGGAGLSASLQTVGDGSGSSSVLQLSTTVCKVNATSINVNGFALSVTGTSSITGTNTGDQTTISGNAGSATNATNIGISPIMLIPFLFDNSFNSFHCL